MKQTSRTLLAACAAVLLGGGLLLYSFVHSQNVRPVVSEAVRVDVEKLGNQADAYNAGQRLAAKGDAIVPELITALEDTLAELAQYDPENLGEAQDAYASLMQRQASLMGLIGAAGSRGHVERLAGVADLMHSGNMAASSYFRMLDALGAQERADAIAAEIVENPGSDSMKLIAAMVRYYFRTPAAVADSAELHFDNKMPMIRAMAYQMLINAGRGDEIQARLVDEVSRLEYSGGGNKAMLQALAVMEPPETFLPRIEGLRLAPHVKKAATIISRFAWSGDDEREAMISGMLGTNDRELDLHAIQYMLENDRVDLLEQYRLVSPAMRQIEYYRLLVPGFDEMSRERLLQHMSAEEVDQVERQKSSALIPVTSPTMRLALQRLGYALEKRGGAVVIVPPVE